MRPPAFFQQIVACPHGPRVPAPVSWPLMRLGLALVVLAVAGCDCATRVQDKRFLCANDDNCVEGFVCVAGECVREGGSGGGAAGGEAGGAAGGTAGGAAGGTAGGAAGGTAGGAAGGTAGGAAGGTAGGAAGGTAGGSGGGGAGGGAPTSLAFITTPPSPLLAGTCFLATVQARLGAVAAPVATNTTVGLSVSVTGGSRFYSDSTCTASTATALIPAGSANATFYVKPITGAFMTVTAAAPFGSAMQGFFARPVVRRGSCSFNPGTTADGGLVPDFQIDCTINPALSSLASSFVLVAQSSDSSNAAELMARCWLIATDRVRCERGTGSENPTVTWQTVELPQGLTVHHVRGPCPSGGVTAITLPTAVNPASAFVLKTVNTTGSALDDEETSTVRLTSSTTALLETDGCNDYAVQVVDLAGIDVTRGVLDAGFPIGADSVQVLGLPPTTTNAALLTQVRTTLSSVPNDCELTVRGDLPTNASVVFTRGAGTAGACSTNPIDQLVFERIDFGARGTVQKLTATLPATSTSVNVAISPVDTTRAIVFASSQVFNGQGGGETTGAFAEIDEAAVRFELTSATNVRVVRGDEDDLAVVTFFVVELEP